MHHITNWSPIGQQERRRSVTASGTGLDRIWPEVVNI
jgi:hypothetical protein